MLSIESEQSFIDHLHLMHGTTFTLLDVAPKYSEDKSEMVKWIEKIRIIQENRRFPEGMRFQDGIEQLSLATVQAYYLSSKIVEKMKAVSGDLENERKTHFEIFNKIRLQLEEEPPTKQELSNAESYDDFLSEFCEKLARILDPKEMRLAFAMGLSSVTGQQSPAFLHFSSSPLFNPQLVNMIYHFAGCQVEGLKESSSDPEPGVDKEKTSKLSHEAQLAEVLTEFLQDLIPSLQSLREAYPIKGFMRMIEWEKPRSLTEGLTSRFNAGDVVDKNNGIFRSIAFVTEFIIKEARKEKILDKMTIYRIQNAIVGTGLYFGENGHPLFPYGAMFSLPTLFKSACPKEKVLTWYFLDKIVQCFQDSIITESDETNFDPENLILAVQKDYQALLDIISSHMNNFGKEFIEALGAYLDQIKEERGFGDKEILVWMSGFRDILKFYDICENHPMPKELENGCVKILVVGDSVSAGLRIPHLYSGERWVTQLEKALKISIPTAIVINASISGCIIEQGVKNLEDYLKFFKPHIVLCTLGGNDVYLQNSLPRAYRSMLNFVKICEKHGIEPKHVIWGSGIPLICEADLCTRRSFSDMFSMFEEDTNGAIGVELPKEIFTKENMHEDGLHFTHQPQKALAGFAYDKVRPIAKSIYEEMIMRAMTAKKDYDPAQEAPRPVFVPQFEAVGATPREGASGWAPGGIPSIFSEMLASKPT